MVTPIHTAGRAGRLLAVLFAIFAVVSPFSAYAEDGETGVVIQSKAQAGNVSGIVAAANGGTGVNGSSAANGRLLIGNGSGFTLANLTAGNGIGLTNGAGSITVSPKSYLIGADCTAHSITGTVSETVLKTISVNATTYPIAANSVITIHTLWSYTGSTNNKTMKVHFGAAGAGTGGTLMLNNVVATTGQISLGRDIPIYVRSTSSEITYVAGATSHEGPQVNALTTAAIDLTANWEIAVTGTLANTGETIQLEAVSIEVETP